MRKRSKNPHGKTGKTSSRESVSRTAVPSQGRRKPAHRATSSPRTSAHRGPPAPRANTQPSRKPTITCPPHSVMIWGRHAVESALANRHRRIIAVYADEDAAPWLNEALGARKISCHQTERSALDEATGEGDKAVHQGVIVIAKHLEAPHLDDWLDSALPPRPLVVMLDQLTDARNIGAIMRSAYAFGATAIIATDRHTPHETATMLRAASGAAELIPLIRVVNLARTIETLQKHDFTAVGMDMTGGDDLNSLADDERLAIVIGGEGGGLRRLTREKVNKLARIPIIDEAESLNVSVAAAVALYAACRKK